MNAKQRKQAGQQLYDAILAELDGETYMLDIDADTHNTLEGIFTNATCDQYNSSDLILHVCNRSGHLDLAACVGCFR